VSDPTPPPVPPPPSSYPPVPTPASPGYPAMPPSAPPPPPPSYGGVPGYPPQQPPPPYGAPPGYGSYGNWNTPGFPHHQYAGFWARLGALLLDGLFVTLLALPFIIPGIVLFVRAYDDCTTTENFDGTTEVVCPPGAFDGASFGGGMALFIGGGLLVWIFFLRMLARTGQTWGRRIANIKVVRADNGQAPGWGKAIGRSLFAGFISANCCYLGYLWMLWDGEKRTWHDMAAGTRVIRA
jgi:uncharacterized RDD family membrane protein YckC